MAAFSAELELCLFNGSQDMWDTKTCAKANAITPEVFLFLTLIILLFAPSGGG